MKNPAKVNEKAARKTIKRMQRDPVKWRVAEHLHESLKGTHALSAQGCYHLASQIVDDIAPIILAQHKEK